MRLQGLALAAMLLAGSAATAAADSVTFDRSAPDVSSGYIGVPGHVGIDLQGVPVTPSAKPPDVLLAPERDAAATNVTRSQVAPGAIGCAQETQPSGITPEVGAPQSARAPSCQ